jgi:hypothetical protein
MEGLYRKEKSKLEEYYFEMKNKYVNVLGDGFFNVSGEFITIDKILECCIYKGFRKELAKIDDAHGKVAGRNHLWIGVNPPPDQYDLKSLYDKFLTIENKTIFTDDNFLWTVEQNTKSGIRPHIHLMLETKTRPARIIDIFSKKLKIPKTSIHIDSFRNNRLWDEHVSYIKGNKSGEKTTDVNQDKIDRESLDIPDYLGKLDYLFMILPNEEKKTRM